MPAKPSKENDKIKLTHVKFGELFAEQIEQSQTVKEKKQKIKKLIQTSKQDIDWATTKVINCTGHLIRFEDGRELQPLTAIRYIPKNDLVGFTKE
jgi:hypothetical protein